MKNKGMKERGREERKKKKEREREQEVMGEGMREIRNLGCSIG